MGLEPAEGAEEEEEEADDDAEEDDAEDDEEEKGAAFVCFERKFFLKLRNDSEQEENREVERINGCQSHLQFEYQPGRLLRKRTETTSNTG